MKRKNCHCEERKRPCLPAGREAIPQNQLDCFAPPSLAMTFLAIIISFSSLAFGQDRSEAVARSYLNEKPTPQTLIKLGDALDKMSDVVNTGAERECFRSPGKLKGTACMNAYAEKLNATYGAGAFEYQEALVLMRYTGVHYKKVVDEFPKSDEAPEAAFLFLSKNLIGSPEQVLPRIKEYMSKYSNGEWGRRGRLLWARINEDVWWIHRKWSWVLYNWQISPEELIIKAEPYRQEALKMYQEIVSKDGKTEEVKLAKKELELLKDYKDDGKLYGIVNEAGIGGISVKPGHE